MKLRAVLVLVNACCWAALPAAADVSLGNSGDQQTSTNTQNLANYLLNLGYYLGYNLNNAPSPNPGEGTYPASVQLFNQADTLLTETLSLASFFGSIPVTMSGNSSSASSSSSTSPIFVPANTPGANMINSYANTTFSNPPYQTPQASTGISANSLADQYPYQEEPVSQTVFNILGTPDVSYCTVNVSGQSVIYNPTNPNDTGARQTCPALNTTMFKTQILENIIGKLPNPEQFYTYETNQPLIPQLNSNTLLAPLLYSTTAPSSSTSSSGASSTDTPSTAGLAAQTQAQQAANFIRYASGSIIPVSLPSYSAYSSMYTTALPVAGKPSTPDQINAQATLSTYLTNLRVYAAQASVGAGNLYYILSKRIPQPSTSNSGASAPTSEALNEYNMATRRIFNVGLGQSSSGQPQQWVEQINNASSATVQKEIAVLLSEINYQLYLDRQIQERLLVTFSVLQLQSLKSSESSLALKSPSSNKEQKQPE